MPRAACWPVACLAVALAAPISAQAPPSSATITQALKSSWESAKKNIVASADVMPEANYAFRPVDDVRTFGQILAHIAGANYIFCAAARGETSTVAEDEFEKKATTRSQIVKALAASMAYCDAAFTALTDQKLGETITMPFGMGPGSRAGAIMANIGHLNEHYGNLVTYMRMKGIVPPSSRG